MLLRRLLLFAAVALFCLAAAGCGGGGGMRSDSAAPRPAADETARAAEDSAPASASESSGGAEDVFSDPFAGEEVESAAVADPIEPVNRFTFWINDKLYFYMLKPVAKGYRYVLPSQVRSGVGNFFTNLGTPVRAVNSFLQFKAVDGLTECMRFIINSTVGVFGFMDIARDYGGLKVKREDLGQTFGYYGAGHGFYLVLPFFGPSSLRDTVGRAGDYFLEPLQYSNLSFWERGAARGVDVVNELALDPDTYEALVGQSLDPYLTFRNGYIQLRNARVGQ